MRTRYQSVVSIGTQCLTSTLLKRAGLKAFSGPFDWIFSSLEMVGDCIETDFADLLNKDFLKPIPIERRPDPTVSFANHMLYRARYELDSIFNHYDPRDPERYAYLRRCVRRMRTLLASEKPQLLLAIGRPEQCDQVVTARLFGLLDRMTVAAEAWIILVEPPGTTQEFILSQVSGRHRIYRFAPYGSIDGIIFADERDNAFLIERWNALIQLDCGPLSFDPDVLGAPVVPPLEGAN
jgi:hypothetical protein